MSKKLSALRAVALLGLTVVAAGCGGAGPEAASDATTTVVSTAPAVSAPTTTTAPPTSSTRATSQGAVGGPPAGGAVPRNFDPVSFTAVSASDFWLLGDAPCANPVCTSIVRTTDGGSHFVGIPAPSAPIQAQGSTSASPPAGGISTLRFADDVDGYAFATGPGGAFWDTHDGGAQWAQPTFMTGRELLGFGTGGGYAFALVGSCPSGTCSGVALERSPVTAEQWTALSLPVPAGTDQVATMTVHGPNLWISVTTSGSQANQLLVAGTGSGAHFTTSASPCFAGLGGSIQASSANVLWAVCPSGMMAEAFRSSDGGVRWQTLSPGELENSALLAPASDTTAIIQPASQGQLLRTGDGGATWQSVSAAGAAGSWWSWIGFTDASSGSGLEQSNAPANWPWPNGPFPEQLWRSADGGASWTGPVPIG